jgi:peptidoglycan hydrolase-like protein with peptidoglycan-binding domain
MARIGYLIVLVMLGVLVSGAAQTASAMPRSSPPPTTLQSHTVCHYVSDTTRPELKRGSSGNAVRQVQCLINHYSFYPILLDVVGSFGPRTDAAGIFNLECGRRYGLPGTFVDGKVGPQTWNILYNQPPACGIRP